MMNKSHHLRGRKTSEQKAKTRSSMFIRGTSSYKNSGGYYLDLKKNRYVSWDIEWQMQNYKVK